MHFETTPLGMPEQLIAMQRVHWQTTLAISGSCILEKADEIVLAALYAAVGQSLNASPTDLGLLTLSRALVQALASPLGGLSGYVYDRGILIGVGCIAWGISCLLFSLTSTLAWSWLLWSLNGFGLALVIPNAQPLTADLYPSSERGRAFGMLFFMMQAGGMLGGIFATNIGGYSPFGIEGWRVAFLSFAIISGIWGIVSFICIRDPREKLSKSSTMAELISMAHKELVVLLKTPTFLLIVAQGTAGSIPWAALGFLTLYLQLLGFGNKAASIIVATFLGGTAFGGLLGGVLGDKAAARWPLHGRICVTQFSVASGIPFALIIFKLITSKVKTATAVLYSGIFLLFALVKAWPQPALNGPVFAEIVPEHHRTLIYAMDRCFEGIIAAFAVPLVGVMSSQIFGFEGNAETTSDAEHDYRNAVALGSALTYLLLWYRG